eukprot:114234-Prorocentrum_minimum.AAC.1
MVLLWVCVVAPPRVFADRAGGVAGRPSREYLEPQTRKDSGIPDGASELTDLALHRLIEVAAPHIHSRPASRSVQGSLSSGQKTRACDPCSAPKHRKGARIDSPQ